MGSIKARGLSGLSASRVQEALKRIGDEKHRDTLWRYYTHCRAKDFDWSRAGAEIGYSKTTLYRLFTGTYKAEDVAKVCAEIESYLHIAYERESYRQADFVETETARRIWKACEAALFAQTIFSIYGQSQVGKTWALEAFAARNNHGHTCYVRLSANGGVCLFLTLLCRACGISPHSNMYKLRESILEVIDDKTLLIVDEIHLPFLTYAAGARVQVLELIREIYDRTHCGVVLSGTDVWPKEIEHGQHKDMLEQLRRRFGAVIKLPAKPTRRDLDMIAAAFGLPPAEGDVAALVGDMASESGLCIYTQRLKQASRLAAKRGEKLNWGHFTDAHGIIESLAGRRERSQE